MAAHYDTAILPARPRRPRDKAKVEQAVLIVERWLLGRLRHRRFYSLAELNAAIGELLHPAQRGAADPAARRDPPQAARGDSTGRRSSPCRRALTSSPNGGCAGSASTTTSRSRRISTACRTASPAPRSRCGSPPAPSRSSSRASGSPRICASSGNHKHTTVADHMPSSHRRYADWTIERIRRDAAAIGPATAALCELILDERAASRTGLPLLSRHHPPGAIRSAPSGSKPPPRAPSRSARAPTARSDRSSTTSSIAALHPSGPRTTCRSSIPTSAARATTNLGDPILLTHPTLDQLNALGLHRHGQGLRRDRSLRRGRKPHPCRMARAAARSRSVAATRQAAVDAAALRQAAPPGRRRGYRLSRPARPRSQPVPQARRRRLDRRPRQL